MAERGSDFNTKRKHLAAVVRVSEPSLSVFQNLLLSGCGDPLPLCPGFTGESVHSVCIHVCETVCLLCFVCVCVCYISEISLDHKGVNFLILLSVLECSGLGRQQLATN